MAGPVTKAERRQLERFVATGPAYSVNLAAYLRSKAPKRKAESPYRIAKKQERLIRKGERASVRAAVVLRANGRCECGCNCAIPFVGHSAFTPELDHFFGRAHAESVETCWLLARIHHQSKTENYPTREYWDALFADHCKRHGYPPPRKRLTKDIQVAGPEAK